MKKVDLKELIISKNGKILNWRKFQYNGTNYCFHYFIKDWNQSSNFFFKHRIKSDYIKQLKIFEEKGLIEIKKKEKPPFGFFDMIFYSILPPYPFFILSFLFVLLFIIAFPPLYWMCASKIKYEDLDIRVKELKKWKSVAPAKHFNDVSYTEKEKLKWSFQNFIMHNYALKTERKVFISFKNYQEIKDRWNE